MNRFQFLPRGDNSIILDPFFHTNLPRAGLKKASRVNPSEKRRTPVKLATRDDTANTTSNSSSSSNEPRFSFSKSKTRTRHENSKLETKQRPSIVQTTLSSHNETPKRCDWSRDPTQCPQSNWTIHVYRQAPKALRSSDSWDTNTDENDACDSYYINIKALDQLPEDRTPLFEKIFMECLEDVGNNESRIVIEDEVTAQGFGVLLDFLYAKSNDEEIALLSNVQRGQALYRIADYFGVVELKQRVVLFYEDMTRQIVRGSAVHNQSQPAAPSSKPLKSKTLRKEKKRSRLEALAHNVSTREAVEQDVLKPKRLLHILQQRKSMGLEDNKVDSENISCLVALCVQQNQDKLTRKMFYSLSSELYIPHIDQEAALQLLTTEQELGYWTDSDNFSSVQSRCIRSLVADWSGLRKKFQSDELYWKALRNLSPSILGVLLMQASKHSQMEEDLSSITETA